MLACHPHSCTHSLVSNSPFPSLPDPIPPALSFLGLFSYLPFFDSWHQDFLWGCSCGNAMGFLVLVDEGTELLLPPPSPLPQPLSAHSAYRCANCPPWPTSSLTSKAEPFSISSLPFSLFFFRALFCDVRLVEVAWTSPLSHSTCFEDRGDFTSKSPRPHQ
eukprot:RCo003819